MSTVMLRVNYEHRRFGNGYSVRVVQLPIYTYVENWEDVDQRLHEAISLFRSGFHDDGAFLRYLRANHIEPIVDGVEMERRQVSAWVRAMDEIECSVAVA